MENRSVFFKFRIGTLLIACSGLGIFSAWAGGGGGNVLVVVNPGDEQQVRIANAYQKLHDIADNHFVFIEPRTVDGVYRIRDQKTQGSFSYVNELLIPIYDHMMDQGLNGSIDYITTLGQSTKVTGLSGGTSGNIRAHDFLLRHVDALATGVSIEDLSTASPRYNDDGASFPFDVTPYQEGDNPALIHSADDLYVTGTLGYTGIFGNSPTDIISNLTRTAQSAGTHPVGTIYYEENNNIRSNIREFVWPNAQTDLTARGIPFVETSNTPGSAPRNRNDVRGAVIGAADYAVPNGSTYLPGSWADSLTSYGCDFDLRVQTKASELIRAGVGGTSGTVTEPGASPMRFPRAYIHLYLADGSTLGEALQMSVRFPHLISMLGDPLGQPYADVSTVTLLSGPADEGLVSGSIQWVANATLNSFNLATGLNRIDLYVDGRLTDTVVGNNGTFTVDTTALSDGRHRFRFVGVNNAAARSQGHLLRHVMVSNAGRSVSAGGDLDVGTAVSVNIPVSSAAGAGVVSRIELRHLGRVVGQLPATAGLLNLTLQPLAYGDNTVTPVAVFSDGAEVQGTPIVITRAPSYWPGQTPLLPGNRQHGILGEYFPGQGGTSIAASSFNGVPAVSVLHSRLFVGVHNGTDASKTRLANQTAQLGDVEAHPIGSVSNASLVDGLSARYSGRFEVVEDGEYNFFFFKSSDSAELLINGIRVQGFDNHNFGFPGYYSSSVFLAKGEHTLRVLSASTNIGVNPGFSDIALYVRGPDGKTKQPVDSSMFYQHRESISLADLVEDDYESYGLNGNVGGINGWVEINKTSNQGATVVATNSPLSAGSQAVHFADSDPANVSDARIQNIFPEALLTLQISFDFMASTSVQMPLLTIRSGTAVTIVAQQAVALAPFVNSGEIRYHDGSVWQVIPAGLALNTWYRFELTLDAATDTFSLVVSDGVVEWVNETGLSFRNPTGSLRSLDFATNAGFGQNGGSFYLDNLRVFLPVANTSRYALWSNEFSLIGGLYDDEDNDGLLNLYEYGLGGDPTNGLSQGLGSIFEGTQIGESNVLVYVYARRRADDSGIRYWLETTDDLQSTNWTDAGYQELSAEVINTDFEAVTNLIDTVEPHQFIRLNISTD